MNEVIDKDLDRAIRKLVRSFANRITYRCDCGEVMHLSDEDVWGKIVRCVKCTKIVANNLKMLPPKHELAALRARMADKLYAMSEPYKDDLGKEVIGLRERL